MAYPLDALCSELAAHGLMPRGVFDCSMDEHAPLGLDGHPAAAVVLVGHAGGSIWPHFSRWRERQVAALENPLDAWSREVLERAGKSVGARAVFPSDRPFLPFQQWAMGAEGLKPSPLGILMHPDYGLWHAYRGALLFSQPVAAAVGSRGTEPRPAAHLCDACPDKPCLGACPVRAHSTEGFDYAGCLDHVRSSRGTACRTHGCLDRNACPHGAEYRYSPEQQAFHMNAFAGLD